MYSTGACVYRKVLYGNQVIDYSKTDIKNLQTIENKVYRYIFGAPIHTPICTLRGDIGASDMMSRLLKNKIIFVKYLLKKEGSVIQAAYKEMSRSYKKDAWIKEVKNSIEYTDLTENRLTTINDQKIKNIVRQLDTNRWRQDLETKSSLKLYKENKTEVKEEPFYDNTPSSITLFRCRSNTLQLNDRKRFKNESTKCLACTEENENLEHFILNCTHYQDIRNKSGLFTRPYTENKLAELLFGNNDNKQETKITIQKMWLKREKLRKQQENN